MVMYPLTIKNLASGGVIVNYHCVSRCGHCLYNCSPQRSKTYLDAFLAEKIFSRIKKLGCRSVHIGGGEPLLRPDLLLDVLREADKAGVAIEYVETNSAWYVDAQASEKILRDLIAAGVNTLLVSISPFHNAHIPYDRVTGIIAACRQTGMTVFPWVNAFVRDIKRFDVRQTHDMSEFEAVFGPDYMRRIPEVYWIHLGGRALDTFATVYPRYPAAEILDQSPLSCARALSDTGHFHIDLHGHYIPGLCAGMVIAMEDLGGPLAVGAYPLLDCLSSNGIRGLFELADQDYGYKPQRDRFLNHCDLCTDIRHFLWQHHGDRFPDLAPDGFYAERPQRL
jgi:hypothetical protein